MRIIDARFFGVLSGLLIGMGLTLFSFVLRISLIYSEPIGQIPIYLGLIPIVLIILFALGNNKMKRRTLNLIYLGVTIFSFVYIFSKLEWTVKCCPDNYESMYDWNAAKGISWMIFLPLTFIITLIQGLTFDILRELRR